MGLNQRERIDNRNKLNKLITETATSISVATFETINSIITKVELLTGDFHELQDDFLISQSGLLSEARKKKMQLDDDKNLRDNKKRKDNYRKSRTKKEQFITNQENSAKLAFRLLALNDKEIIGMTRSYQSRGIELLLENAIEGSFGEDYEEISKIYRILKSKLSKSKSDLLEKEAIEQKAKVKKLQIEEVESVRLSEGKDQARVNTLISLGFIPREEFLQLLTYEITFDSLSTLPDNEFDILIEDIVKDIESDKEVKEKDRLTQFELNKSDTEKIDQLIFDIESLNLMKQLNI